jgi:hypothetical protein
VTYWVTFWPQKPSPLEGKKENSDFYCQNTYIEGDNSFPDKVKRVGIGNVRFTRYGQELFDLLQSSRTVPLPRYGEDIFGFTIQHWNSKKLKMRVLHYDPNSQMIVETKYNY